MPVRITHRNIKGLGDIVEKVVKPIAKLVGADCLDAEGKLKSESECAKKRDRLNKAFPLGKSG